MRMVDGLEIDEGVDEAGDEAAARAADGAVAGGGDELAAASSVSPHLASLVCPITMDLLLDPVRQRLDWGRGGGSEAVARGVRHGN